MSFITRRLFLQALASTLLLKQRSLWAAQPPRMVAGQLPAPDQIHRVVSAGAPADMLLLAAAPEKLAGFSSFDFSRSGAEILPPSIRQLPKYGRLAGRASTLSLEQLLALKPDLIVDCGNADGTWVSAAQRVNAQTHIPWLLISGRLADSARQLTEVGAVLGVEARTTPQAALAQQFISGAQAFSRTRAAQLRFYAARGPRGLETGLKGSLHTEAAELLGLTNVAEIPGRTGLTQVSMENLLQWQPDIILVQDAVTHQYLKQDPLWQGVRAVAQNRILYLGGLPFGWLDAPPGINRLLGLRRLHGWLDSATGHTFKQEMARYATLFWHAPLTDAQFAHIMGAR